MMNRVTRYHLAEQNDGRGWMILRLEVLGAGFEKTTATVIACNLSEPDARLQLSELRAAEVLESDYPIDLVDEELREAGLDPKAIGDRGVALVRELLAKRREQAS